MEYHLNTSVKASPPKSFYYRLIPSYAEVGSIDVESLF